MSMWCEKCQKIKYNKSKCDFCGYEEMDKSHNFILPKRKKVRYLRAKNTIFYKLIEIYNGMTDKFNGDNRINDNSVNNKMNQYKEQYTVSTGRFLTLGEVANFFKKSQYEINHIFLEFSWIEIKDKWTIPTNLGLANGAESFYNAKTKMKYVKWEENILENQKLLEAIKKIKNNKTSYKDKIDKGAKYEEYIAKYYKELGYTSIEHGKLKGREDEGIDLIVKKNKEIIFIQCKDWKENGSWKITQEKILAFRMRARDFVEKRPIFKQYDLTARYTLSGDFIHPSAIKHIEEIQKQGKKVDYEIIKNKEAK